MPAVGDARERQSIRFYLIAMIFLLFDIEVAFLYPWALALRELGWSGYMQVVLFTLVLVAGYVYVWKKVRWIGVKSNRSSTAGDIEPGRLRPGFARADDEGRQARAVGASVFDLAGTFGLACCAIEMMAMSCARYDIARFGAEVFRGSPRQSDLMIVAGGCREKWRLRCAACTTRCPSPSGSSRWGRAHRSAASSTITRSCRASIRCAGGRVCPGCPPRPESLIYGIVSCRKRSRASAHDRRAALARPGRGAGAGESIDQPTIRVPAASLVEVCLALRDRPEFGFILLADVTAVDWWPRSPDMKSCTTCRR